MSHPVWKGFDPHLCSVCGKPRYDKHLVTLERNSFEETYFVINACDACEDYLYWNEEEFPEIPARSLKRGYQTQIVDYFEMNKKTKFN